MFLRCAAICMTAWGLFVSAPSADGSSVGYSQGSWGSERIQFASPVLAPVAYARHCLQYPQECNVRRMAFRGGNVTLTRRRWDDLLAINATVNRSIKPERNLAGIAWER